MARKNRLTKAAVSIGAAVGKADRTAHKFAKAGLIAKKELEGLTKEIEAIKSKLRRTTRKLKKALR
ncbi:MAG: hypothetical protein ACRD5R_09980 [Candidatus Acidiferrales bacterium]